MFEFLELIDFGRVFEAHGEKWQKIKYIKDGYNIAIKDGDKLPCQLFLVKEEKKEKEIKEEEER